MTDPPAAGMQDRAPRDGQAVQPGFDATLAGCRDELFAYMRKRLGDRETAADLAQETLSRMMKYRDAPEIEDHRRMLFRIANNLVIEFQRARARHHEASHVSLSEIDPLRNDEPPVEAIVDAQRAVDLLIKRTIVSLPPRCALAFVLNRFDGLSYRQVAERMGISVKMVEAHISRALLACRVAVGDRDF